MKVLQRRRGAVLVNSVLGVALLAGGALAYTTVNSSTAAASKPTTRSATVTKGTVLATVSGSGSLSSPTDAGEDFVTGGKLTAVKVAVGDTVTAGEVLATVDTTAAQQQVTSAQGALTTAQASVVTAQANLTKAQAGTTTTTTVPVQGGQTQASYVTSATPSPGSTPAATRLGATTGRSGGSGAGAGAGAGSGTGAGAGTGTGATTTAAGSGTGGSGTGSGGGTGGGTGGSGGSATVPTPQTTTITTTKVDDAAVAQAQQQLTQAQQQVVTAQTALTNAQTALAGTTLTASVAGTVASVSNKVGDTVSGSGSSASGTGGGSSSSSSKTSSAASTTPTGFIVLTNPTGMQVTASFSELDSLKLKKGEAATVTLNAQSDTKLNATVLSVSPLPTSSGTGSSSAVQYSATLQINGDTSKLRTGLSATIAVVTGEADNALSVPAAALSGTGTTRTATVVKADGSTSRVSVTVGVVGDSTVQVVDGLNEGDKVQIASTTTGGSNGFPSGSFPGLTGGGAAGGLGGGTGGGRTGGGGSKGGN